MSESTDYIIKELSLVIANRKRDITSYFQELNIFDSVMMPCVSGNILMIDASALSDLYGFDGDELIFISLGTKKSEKVLERTFRIYKQSDRRMATPTSESYILHFVSDELIFSEQQKINRSYTGLSYTEIVEKILFGENSYLNIPTERKKQFTKSQGLHDVIIPNLTPLEAANWCSRKAVDESKAPTFLFFENLDGYFFTTLKSISKSTPVGNVLFGIKNIDPNDEKREASTASYFEVIGNFDFLKNTKDGVFASKFIGVDPLIRNIRTFQISYGDNFSKISNGGPLEIPIVENKKKKRNNEMYDSRKTLYYATQNRIDDTYIKAKAAGEINKADDTHNYITQRKSIFSAFFSTRVRVVLPGSLAVQSGRTVNLNVLRRAAVTGENTDLELAGKYIIIATRHVFHPQKYEVIFDAVDDVSSADFSSAITFGPGDQAVSPDPDLIDQ
jgi:hypothetical protein